MNNKKINNDELSKLCANLEWFDSGNMEQFDKLFELNNKGASIRELAIVIWICSKSVKTVQMVENAIMNTIKNFKETKL